MGKLEKCCECGTMSSWINSWTNNGNSYCELCWHAVLHLDSRFGKGVSGNKNVSDCRECGCLLKGSRRLCDTCEKLLRERESPAYKNGYSKGYIDAWDELYEFINKKRSES